jgi:hypothetical protein
VRFTIAPHRVRPAGRARRLAAAAAATALTALVVGGCGLVSASSGPSSSSSSPASGFSAYFNCLRQHGVNVPTPSASPGSGGGGFGGGGFGGGGFGGSGSGNSTFQKAAQACASLRPSFGGGNGFGGFATALKAFRTCMSDHGEPIPTTRPTSPPASGSAPDDRFLNGLNPKNSKVAAALKACQSKLPSFGSGF